MKCYRCGEENPEFKAGEVSPEQNKLIDEYIQARCDVTDLQTMLAIEKAEHSKLEAKVEDLKRTIQGQHADLDERDSDLKKLLAEQEAELAETHETIETLRCELRRYEPSDGMMFRLRGMQDRIDDAAAILGEIQKYNGVGEDQRASIDAWLKRHRTAIVPGGTLDPERTILALHTVIDEARRLFDYAWDEQDNTDEIGEQTWANIDEWRQRVLVHAARETVSGEVAALGAAVKAVPDDLAMFGLDEVKAWLALPAVQESTKRGAHEYGLALAAEQQKTRLLIGAIEEAARLFEAVTSHKVVFHDRFHAWLAHPTVTAARNEAKG